MCTRSGIGCLAPMKHRCEIFVNSPEKRHTPSDSSTCYRLHLSTTSCQIQLNVLHEAISMATLHVCNENNIFPYTATVLQ